MQIIKANGKTFRVIRIFRMELEHGYLERTEQQYNVLQRQQKILGIKFWKTIEEEPIPAFAWIQCATLGYTDWQSPMLQKINNQTHPIFTS